MRTTCVVLACFLPVAGCASGRVAGMPNRSAARNVLIGVALGTAAIAIGSAVAGNSVESKLRDDLQAGNLSGREFADRDAEGRRWNRVARASAFASGIAVIGIGVVWEASLGDRRQEPGPGLQSTPEIARKPLTEGR